MPEQTIAASPPDQPSGDATKGCAVALITLVVPVHNEEDAIAPFVVRANEVFADLDAACEILFVNDGSRDGTEREIEALMVAPNRIKLINLSRNFGKESALAAGLRHAGGDAVIPMDVDLQDPPELIPEMIALWRNGAKIVNAKRSDRSKDSWIKRLTARGFYTVFNMLAEYPIPADVGDFRLLDREVVETLREITDRSRFNKGIFSWIGFETAELSYERPERQHGTTSWSYWKLWKLALDGIFSNSTLPLRIWTYFGISLAIFSVLYSVFILLFTLTMGRDVPGYASTIILILIFGGVNMIALGIIGEYVGRIYTEVRQRPLFIIRSIKETEDPHG